MILPLLKKKVQAVLIKALFYKVNRWILTPFLNMNTFKCLVRFHEVGTPRQAKPAYSTSNGRIFLRTLCARISRVLRVRRPEARRWNGRDLYFPKLCLKSKNIEIKIFCIHQAFRLLLTVIKFNIFEKCQK